MRPGSRPAGEPGLLPGPRSLGVAHPACLFPRVHQRSQDPASGSRPGLHAPHPDSSLCTGAGGVSTSVNGSAQGAFPGPTACSPHCSAQGWALLPGLTLHPGTPHPGLPGPRAHTTGLAVLPLQDPRGWAGILVPCLSLPHHQPCRGRLHVPHAQPWPLRTPEKNLLLPSLPPENRIEGGRCGVFLVGLYYLI